MSILIGQEIERALQTGTIKIEPFDRSQIGPGSVDLTLGNDFRVFRKQSHVYHVTNEARFEDLTTSVHVENGSYVVIRPGVMILGSRGSGSRWLTTSLADWKGEADSHGLDWPCT